MKVRAQSEDYILYESGYPSSRSKTLGCIRYFIKSMQIAHHCYSNLTEGRTSSFAGLSTYCVATSAESQPLDEAEASVILPALESYCVPGAYQRSLWATAARQPKYFPAGLSTFR